MQKDIEQRIKKAYKEGWKDCAGNLMEATRILAHSLRKIREDAFKVYLEGDKNE
jgi:hypothetical protein